MENPTTTTKTIHCTGTPYEIGFTHGSSAAQEIHANIAIYADFFKDRAKLSWDQARERASAFLPALTAHYPDILEEMKGIAEGAGRGLIMEDILTINVRSEIGLTNFSDGCSSISQKGPDGRMFLAQNWDWLESLGDNLVILYISPDNNSGLEMKFVSEAGIVGKIGMNSAGVGTCLNALLSGAQSKEKFPIHIALRRILQFAASFDEAFAIVEKHGLASTANILVADKSGNAGSMECSPYGNTVIPLRSDVTFPFVAHTNHLCAPNRPVNVKDFPEENSFSRLARLEELTLLDTEKNTLPSYESIRVRLSDQQAPPYSICLSRPPKEAVGMDRVTTVFTIIMELAAGVAKVTIGRPCDDLPVITVQM